MASVLSTIVGTPIQFWGQGADPNCETLAYSWDFDGDGTADSSLQSPAYTPTAAGDTTVTLTVTDASGNTATATCQIIVELVNAATDAPAVSLRCYTLLAETGLVTHMIAEAQGHAATTITSFDWDFDGDGAFDLNDPVADVSTQTNTFTGSEQVIPRVRANASDGSSSIASMTIFLCPVDSMPQYGAGVQVEYDPRQSGGPDQTVGGTDAFIAYGGAPGGGVTTHLWDFEDGIFDDAVGREAVSPAWPHDLGLPARVECTDPDGNLTTAEAALAIVDTGSPAPDYSPTAVARACTVLGSRGTPIQFLGFGDDPEDGAGVTYSWDFDGDGTPDSALQNPTFTFSERGLYTPTLRVEDTTGNFVFAYLTLIIECCDAEGGAPPGQWFKCECDPIAFGHGGTGTVQIFCTSCGVIPSLPTQTSLSGCNGSFALGQIFGAPDPNCTQITTMPAIGMPLMGGPPPPGAPFTFDVMSTEVHGPPHAVPYTFNIRLRDPGIMSINQKCFVWVIHGWVQGNCNILGSAPNFVAQAQITLPPPGANMFVPGPGELMPEIVEMQLVHGQQLPPWASSNYNAAFPFAAPNWVQIPNPNALQLAVDPVLGPTMQPGFQEQFEWQYQSPNPPAPPVINALYFDAAGNLVAADEIFVGP